MKGFDAEFSDLDQYIRVITDRIWEGRRLEDIYRYYSADCAVETPAGVSIGVQPVVDGTRATLAAFPDRRLLAEDVIISGDEEGGYLSSHRIFSPMTHAGPGPFGPPSGRPVFARTIADCVCVGNRIVHEWLVRDQAAIARQIGLHERDLAQRWLNEKGPFAKPAMPPAPDGYISAVASSGPAADYAGWLLEQLTAAANPATALRHHEGVISALPAGQAAVGREAVQVYWQDLRAALPTRQVYVEHAAHRARPGRATAVAVRWRAQAEHAGVGRFGSPTGRPVEIMGISHAEIEQGLVVREWHLIDEVALWMQILEPKGRA